MKLIFTAVVGRSGQSSLNNIFNNYGEGCFAEIEPPHLIIKRKGLIGDILGIIQRKWIVTHELLGRGKALEWYENQEHEKLDKVAQKKLNRIKKLQRKHKFQTYIEISKYFMRAQYEYIYKNTPDMSLIKLTRDPLLNARSFIKRNKNFYLDNPPPHFKRNCLCMDTKRLTKFQLYLWSWFEIELRYYKFLDRCNIKKVFELKTEDLNNKGKIEEMFDYFDLKYKEICLLPPGNTNVQQGFSETIVNEEDVKEYKRFIEMVPNEFLDKIQYLKDYDPCIHNKDR